MKRKRGVRFLLWLFIAVVAAVLALAVVDERTGGPLGRVDTTSQQEVDIDAAVGDTILISEGTQQNATRLPFVIISVHPGTMYTALVMRGQVAANFGTAAKPYVVLKSHGGNGSGRVGDGFGNGIPILHGVLRIPPLNRNAAKSQFTPVISVVPKREGVYPLDGILCTYRWGLFVYTARLDHVRYVLHIKKGTP